MSEEDNTEAVTIKDAFEVMSVTYDAYIQVNYDTNYITAWAIDKDDKPVACLCFHRHKDTPMLSVNKMTLGELMLIEGSPEEG